MKTIWPPPPSKLICPHHCNIQILSPAPGSIYLTWLCLHQVITLKRHCLVHFFILLAHDTNTQPWLNEWVNWVMGCHKLDGPWAGNGQKGDCAHPQSADKYRQLCGASFTYHHFRMGLVCRGFIGPREECVLSRGRTRSGPGYGLSLRGMSLRPGS
jgi:hypothetical protein